MGRDVIIDGGRHSGTLACCHIVFDDHIEWIDGIGLTRTINGLFGFGFLSIFGFLK